jgi:hypothetical protein
MPVLQVCVFVYTCSYIPAVNARHACAIGAKFAVHQFTENGICYNFHRFNKPWK